MINKKITFNVFFITFFAFVVLYYSYNLYFNKGIINATDQLKESNTSDWIDKNQTTVFNNVEYTSQDSKKKIIIKGQEGVIHNNDKDLINLKQVSSFITLKDGSLIKIYSEYGQYYKVKKNIFFKKNVKILSKDYYLIADDAFYIYQKDLIELKGNVLLKKSYNTISSDLIRINTVTNNVEILMDSKNKKVHGKTK